MAFGRDDPRAESRPAGQEKKRGGAAPVALILLAAAGWGVIGLFSRPMNAAGLSSLQVTFVRSVTVTVLMGALLLAKDRSLFRIHWRDGWIFLGTGLISIIFFNVCYFTTIQLTTLAAASILLYTAPCFVMLMSAVFFKERITVRKLAALALAFTGCVLVSGIGAGGITPFGLLTGVCSGFGYATYSIFGKVALKKYHSFTLIFYTFVVASVCLAPFAHIGEAAAALTGSGQAALAALGLGVVSTFMPYVCYTTGLESVVAGRASVLAFFEPLVATVAGIVAFREPLGLKNTAGIALIFIAIVLLNVPLGKDAGAKGE